MKMRKSIIVIVVVAALVGSYLCHAENERRAGQIEQAIELIRSPTLQAAGGNGLRR